MADGEGESGGGGGGGDEVSVGDLVVGLRGDGDDLLQTITASVNMMDMLTAAANRLDAALASMGAHATQLGKLQEQLNASTIRPPDVIPTNSAQQADVDVSPMAAGMSNEWEGIGAGVSEVEDMMGGLEEAAAAAAEAVEGTTTAIKESVEAQVDAHVKLHDSEMKRRVDEQNVQKDAAKTFKDRVRQFQQDAGGDDETHLSHYTVRRVAYHAGQALGATGVGNDATTAMLLGGMGPTGLAIGGAIALAAVLGSIATKMEELHQTTRAYTQDALASADAWRQVVTAQAPLGKTGEVLNSKTFEELSNTRKLQDAFDEERHDALTFMGTLKGIPTAIGALIQAPFVRGFDNTSFAQDLKLKQQRIQESKALAEQLETVTFQQLSAQARFNEKDTQLATQGFQISSMYEGADKQRERIENAAAQRQAKFTREREERDALVVQALRVASAKDIQGGGSGESVRVDFANTNYFNKLADAEKQKQLDAQTASERVSQAHREAEEIVDIRNQEAQARITATTTGYAREMALLKLSDEQKQAEMIRHGATTEAFVAQMMVNTNLIAAKQRDHAHEIDTTSFDLVERFAVATRAAPPSVAEWDREVRHLTYDLSLTTDEVNKLHDQFKAATQAEANRPINESIHNLSIDLIEAQRQVTALSAAYNKLSFANPEASDDLVRQAALLQQQVKSAQFIHSEMSAIRPSMQMGDYLRDIQAAMSAGQVGQAQANELLRRKEFQVSTGTFAHQELSSIHPMMQIEDYTEQLRQAQESGTLGSGDAGDLLTKKFFDIFGHMDVGTFNSSFNPGQVDVRGVNLNPQLTIGDKIQANGAYLQSMDAKLGQILQREGLH